MRNIEVNLRDVIGDGMVEIDPDMIFDKLDNSDIIAELIDTTSVTDVLDCIKKEDMITYLQEQGYKVEKA